MKKSDLTESEAATYPLSPKLDESGKASLDAPQETESLAHLRDYAYHLTSENDFHPPKKGVDSPSMSERVLSKEGTTPYTVGSEEFTKESDEASERFDADTLVQFDQTSGGFLTQKTQSGVKLVFDKLAKNSKDKRPDQRTGHDLLAREESSPDSVVPSPKPGITKDTYKNEEFYSRPDESKRPIAAALHDLLQASNKYSPSQQSPYLDYSEEGEKAFINGMYSLQKTLGEFNPDEPSLSISELRKIGGELLFKAQSVAPGDAKTLMNNFSKGGYGGTLDKMVLIPHMTQIGTGKVSLDKLRARVEKGSTIFDNDGQNDLLLVQSFEKSLSTSPKDDPLDINLMTAVNANSYGTMNSPGEPFDKPWGAGMALPVIYSILAVGLFGSILLPSIIATIKTEGLPPLRDPESPWTLSMGRNMPAGDEGFGNAILEMLGWPRDAQSTGFGSVMAGLMMFYGLEEPISPFSAIGPDFLESALDIAFAPGYYAVINKGIIRDLETIVTAISDIDFDNGVFAGISSIFRAVEFVFSSFVFKFFLVMSKIGAAGLQSLAPGMTAHGTNVVPYHKQKDVVLSQNNRLSVSRIHGEEGSGAQSPLSLSRHVALYVPSPAVAAMNLQTYGKENLETDGAEPPLRPLMYNAYGKIPVEILDAVEKEIDSEYVPFSIQDLRTNEIISLPAFISSVSDDFSIQHASSHGYGRTDPVQTYSKTTRSINLVFDLIAMNKPDHDYMYNVLNKIVSMCYPQRDRGLIRKQDGDGNAEHVFAQPFSQTPIGSPVIRLRLGDLLRSNKSRTALQNIFGGLGALTLPGKEQTEDVAQKAAENAKTITDYYAQVAVAKREALDAFRRLELPKGTYVVLPEGAFITIQAPGSDKWETFKTLFPARLQVKETKEFTGPPNQNKFGKKKTTKVKGYEIDISPVIENINVASTYGGPVLAKVFAAAAGGSGISIPTKIPPDLSNDPVAILMPDSDVGFLSMDISNNNTGFFANQDSFRSLDEINQFLSSENNPVARSFRESSPGKGLAGVITQLGISYEGALWGTAPGVGDTETSIKAPMRVQITMGFSPIHDAPLGLTADGGLSAPSHPVGSYGSAKLMSVDVGDIESDGYALTKLEEELIRAKSSKSVYQDAELEDWSKGLV